MPWGGNDADIVAEHEADAIALESASVVSLGAVASPVATEDVKLDGIDGDGCLTESASR